MPVGTPADSSVRGDRIPAGLEVLVEVPATSANLGAGYDSFGMALDIRDAVRARITPAPIDPEACVTVSGEGADVLPRSTAHLIHRVAREVLAARGLELGDRLELEARNVIPQSRGMGSSAPPSSPASRSPTRSGRPPDASRRPPPAGWPGRRTSRVIPTMPRRRCSGE